MTQDSLTFTGAQKIAEQIIAYWSARGYHGIKAEPYRLNDSGDFGVRSNVGAQGFPPMTRAGRPRTSGARTGYTVKPLG